MFGLRIRLSSFLVGLALCMSPAVYAETFNLTGDLTNCIYESDWAVVHPEGVTASIKHCGFAGSLTLEESGTHYNSWTWPATLDDGADETIVMTNWAFFETKALMEARETGDGTTTYTEGCKFSVSHANFIGYDHDPEYPTAHSDDYVKATTKYDVSYWPYYATNPAKSLTGGWLLNSWTSQNGETTEQRFHIDLGSAKVIRRIYLENTHDSGTNTNKGVNNFTFWGSNEASAFAELTYATDDDWTQLTVNRSSWDEHVASDISDPQYALVTSSVAYRYYAFKFADNHGSITYMGIRHVELQTEDATSFRLRQGVPLVNAGAAAAAITEDIDGRTRPSGGLPDIGPYEGQLQLLFFPWRPMPLKFKDTWRP